MYHVWDGWKYTSEVLARLLGEIIFIQTLLHTYDSAHVYFLPSEWKLVMSLWSGCQTAIKCEGLQAQTPFDPVHLSSAQAHPSHGVYRTQKNKSEVLVRNWWFWYDRKFDFRWRKPAIGCSAKHLEEKNMYHSNPSPVPSMIIKFIYVNIKNEFESFKVLPLIK